MSANFNPLPLITVKPGLDNSLADISRYVEAYFASSGQDQESLHKAQEELHRIGGVLRMLSLNGLVVFCAEMEKLLQEIPSQDVSIMVRDALRRALFGLTHYLDALADGATNATLRLFNEYQELHQARGLEMAFDIDLFFPSLQVDLPQEVLGAPQEGEAQGRIKSARMQYQQSLLKWLRQDGADAAMEAMAASVKTVMVCVPQNRHRAFWWVAGGLLDCLSHEGVPPELNVKRSLSRIDLKMKSLIEGGEFEEESAMSEMLYLIARSHTVSDMVERIKQIYMLDEYLPEERPLPPSETTALLDEMRTLLNSVEEHWERCTGEDAEACKAFLERAEKLYILSERLDRNTLQFLCKQIHTAAQHVIDAERAPRIAMDMAMALLLLTSGIDHYQHLGNGFHEQCRILSARLQAAQMRMPEDAEKLNDLVALYRQMEQRDVLAPLASEMQGNLQNVEQSLSAFFNNAAKRSELTQINRLMGQVQGGMRLLSLDEADNLLTVLRQVTDRYGQGQTPTAKEMRTVAASISALEEYVNGLAHGQKPDAASLNTMLQDITVTGSISDAVAAQTETEGAASAGVSIRSGGEDAELLEVFLEEAREVMETLRSNLETSRLHLDSRDPLVTMRRSFHTLKGSSRMVGLSELGEVAWAIERAMNKWLQDNKPATPELLEMIGDAEVLFQHWVDMLISGSTSATINTANLLALADAIEHGKEQPLPSEETPQPEPMTESEPVAVPEPEAETVHAEPELKLESESPLSIEIATETPAATPAENEANTDDLEDEGEIQVGTVKLSAMLFNIATEEGEGHVAALRAQQAVMHETDDHPITYDFMRAAHTLAGVNRTMGFKQVAELSQMLELWLEERIDKPNTVSDEQMQMVDQVIQTLDEMCAQIREQRHEPEAQPELVARLKSDREVVATPAKKTEDKVSVAATSESALELDTPELRGSEVSELVQEATESLEAPDFEVGELTLGLAALQMPEEQDTAGVIEPEIDFSSIANEIVSETSTPEAEATSLTALSMLDLGELVPQPKTAEETQERESTTIEVPNIDFGSLQLDMPKQPEPQDQTDSIGSDAIAALSLGNLDLSIPEPISLQVEEPEAGLPQIDLGQFEPASMTEPEETKPDGSTRPEVMLDLDFPSPVAEGQAPASQSAVQAESALPALEPIMLQLDMPQEATVSAPAEEPASFAIAALDMGEIKLEVPEPIMPEDEPQFVPPAIDGFDLQHFSRAEPIAAEVETGTESTAQSETIGQIQLESTEAAAALTEVAQPAEEVIDLQHFSQVAPTALELKAETEVASSVVTQPADAGETKFVPPAIDGFDLQHFSQVEPVAVEVGTGTESTARSEAVGQIQPESSEPTAALAEVDQPAEEVIELQHFSQVEPATMEVNAETKMEPEEESQPVDSREQPAAVESAGVEPASAEIIPEPAAQAEVSPSEQDVEAAESAESAAPRHATAAVQEYVVQDELDEQMLPIFLEEADELYPQISKNLRVWREQPGNSNAARELQRGLHTLKGSARMAGAMRLGELTHRIEDRVAKGMTGPTPDAEFWTLMENYLDRIGNLLEQLQNPSATSFTQSSDSNAVVSVEAEPAFAPASAPIITPVVEPAFAPASAPTITPVVEPVPAPASASSSTPVAELAATPVNADQPVQVAAQSEPTPDLRTIKEEAPRVTSRRERTIRDEIDDQLLPIFLEEAQELYPQIGTTLRAWREQPEDMKQARELQRSLHTLKGSARMAGAMRLGELTHRVEDRVGKTMSGAAPDAEFWSAMDNYLDRIGLAIEQLQNPEAPQTAFEEPEESTAEAATPAQGAVQQAVVAKTLEIGAERVVQAAQLRVRSDVVDRLVNEAGEVSVARARVELELREFKNSVLELTESVNRLRKQLREIEIQAESQMQARTAVSSDSAERFDPLEFDRFTRFQELTRFMNETVHDVQTVQQTLLKNLAETEGALSAQSQMNRDLQQGLMNIRMVPFASVSERLYRIVRQTGKELGKRANLELLGTDVELDRSVLERMTAPFEHLLRNSIAHGLETPEVREQAGKQPIGEIRLSLRQESNEVVFEFSDDGAGLNLEKLRKKAVEQGVLQPDEQVSDEQIMQLIFASGMSTADNISEIAGRGVGMDVVRSEITALGGRIDVTSEAGHGVRFMIHLPLTLAVTKTLMVRVGEKSYAIPASMVEHVHQLKPAALEATYHQLYSEWQGRRYPVHYLPRLLGDESAEIISQPHNPVILLHSGENRVAIHVDELLGNFEAVVKNIGPQLARVPGISGATVSADGSVILILNPIAFTQRISTVRKVGAGPTVAAVAEQVEEVHTVPSVMVVDDSLTVRKITSRLLARAGYQVLTAKDGVDALEQLTEILPSVMLLDVEMPRMDGFELTKRLRQDPRTKAIPIIMITSRTADKHRQFAMELGVNEYMGKPYQEEELLAHIARFIGAGKA